VAWFLPALLVIAGAALYFLLFPAHFDPTFGPMRQLLEQSGAAANIPASLTPEILILLQVIQALLLAPLINALPTLGEEFGWRAYLQPKLMLLGWRRAMLWMGLIWGLWHWPILALGYNYGWDYAGAPWLGMLLFIWFTTIFGIILGWLTIRGGSVWPAVIGHGALNGIAALSTLMMQGEPDTLLGPMAHGLIASIPTALVAIWLWWHPPLKLPANPTILVTPPEQG
jgi:membrane protease YdiL (CAAX protease family)